jgi:Subtilase family
MIKKLMTAKFKKVNEYLVPEHLKPEYLLSVLQANDKETRKKLLFEKFFDLPAKSKQTLFENTENYLLEVNGDIGEIAVQPNWHLLATYVYAAWETIGLNNEAINTFDWNGIVVGQIDTGISDHPAIESSIVKESSTAFPPTPHAAYSDRGKPYAGHGTSSASVICGHDTAAKYFGVAPKVPLIAVRIADSAVIFDSSSPRDIATSFEKAVRYLVDRGVNIINVSMGTALEFEPPESICRAVDYSYAHGVIMIAAAGNVPVPGWPAYPAKLRRCIAIAGLNEKLEPWRSGSSGIWVDCSAPASSINRASLEYKANKPSFGYKQADVKGTTYAAAMTSGAAALWLCHHQTALKVGKYQGWQRIEAFRQILKQSATSFSEPNLSTSLFGAGVLNVGKLLLEKLPPLTTLTRR